MTSQASPTASRFLRPPKTEVDRRDTDYLANPAEGSSWEDAKRRLAGS